MRRMRGVILEFWRRFFKRMAQASNSEQKLAEMKRVLERFMRRWRPMGQVLKWTG